MMRNTILKYLGEPHQRAENQISNAMSYATRSANVEGSVHASSDGFAKANLNDDGIVYGELAKEDSAICFTE